MSSQTVVVDKEKAKQEVRKLVDKYNKVLEERRVSKYNEEMTKKDFIIPMFRALGWDVENSSEVTAEEKISKKRVDYGFRINGIPKFFLEAKALKADLDNPLFSEQAINYAWHKSCTWAVLTDFENIKILNAEWKTTDLFQSIFFSLNCQQFLERFDQLWLLSKEGFEQSLLDKEAEKWGKKSKKNPVGEQLLNDLTKWRAALSKDILKRNMDKHLTEKELDEAVQRIVDRLIFIRNCEDRELEPITLLSTMREWNGRGKGALFEYIIDVFGHFDTEYNSKLFHHHLCDDLNIGNRVLEEIINDLYHTKDKTIKYDFSALDADVLGNVYEQYLGHILKKTAKRATLTEEYARRKEQGIYYTPTYIVDYIVRNTLGELLKEKKGNVKKIRVLDPACGSGSFLIKAFDVLNEYYLKTDKDYAQTQLDLKTGITFKRRVKVLQNNIFGVDLDEQAVEIAQLNLLLKITEKKQRLPLLERNIKCGNSLIGDEKVAGDKAFKWEEEFEEIIKEGGFDVVIGNPPYIDSEEMTKTQPELREAYRIYSVAKGNWDIFCIFLEKGLQLLKKGGYLGMIVPNKLLSADYATQTRKLIQKHKIVAIRDYSKIPVFQASVYPIVILINKEPPKKNKFTAELMEPYGNSARTCYFSEVEQEDLKKTPQNTWAHIFEESGKEILDKILTSSSMLNNLAKVVGASTVSEAYEIKDIIKELSNQKNYFKLINTGTIDRYSSLWSNSKTRYIGASYKKPVVLKEDLKKFSNKRYEQTQKTKIIIAGMMRRLECYLDEGHYLAGKSTTLVLPNKIDSKLLLAILNSKLMTFVYKNLFKSLSLAGGYMRVGPPQIKNLPIKTISEPEQQPIIKLVDKMLSFNKHLNELGDKMTDERAKIEEEIKKIDTEIDESVYKIYGITEDEEEVIEDSLK